MFSVLPSGKVPSKINICSCKHCYWQICKLSNKPGKIVQYGEQCSNDSDSSKELKDECGAVLFDDMTEAI